MSDLVAEVRSLLADAVRVYAGRPSAEALEDAIRRLDAPLRVAIAGKVKAGKSTLLNALVGEELAPTDAGECTRIVTWYHDGTTARVELHPRDGGPRQVRFVRQGRALHVDLDGADPTDVERLDIQWPSQRLREMTLIDTPGIGSISTDVSQRTIDLLIADDHRARDADAVLYLMRHVHGADVAFLEAFHDDEVAQPTPVNAIGVLSRADEVGACRLDALETARRIADRYRTDPALRRLCQTVVPVAGLVAQASATLTESEFRALVALAQLDGERRDALVLSADRFAADDATLPVTAIEREDLLTRLGLYGVRVALDELAGARLTTARQLVDLLRVRSGLDELRATLLREFGGRATVLKARSALDVLEQVLRDDPLEGTAVLDGAVERVVAGAHELAEIRALNQLRSGAVSMRDEPRDRLEQLLSAGPVATRLGLDEAASDAAVRAAVLEALARWQALGEHPLTAQGTRDLARVAVRTCEGLLADLPA